MASRNPFGEPEEVPSMLHEGLNGIISATAERVGRVIREADK